MLLGPGIFPRASVLRLLSNTSRVKFFRYFGVMGASSFDEKSILVNPWIISDCALACCGVVYGVIKQGGFLVQGVLLCL